MDFPPWENAEQQHGGLTVSFLIPAETSHLLSFWSLVANGLSMVVGLSHFPSSHLSFPLFCQDMGGKADRWGAARFWGPQ